jgi:hypothetical protein
MSPVDDGGVQGPSMDAWPFLPIGQVFSVRGNHPTPPYAA